MSKSLLCLEVVLLQILIECFKDLLQGIFIDVCVDKARKLCNFVRRHVVAQDIRKVLAKNAMLLTITKLTNLIQLIYDFLIGLLTFFLLFLLLLLIIFLFLLWCQLFTETRLNF
jgi:hypothetical protein